MTELAGLSELVEMTELAGLPELVLKVELFGGVGGLLSEACAWKVGFGRGGFGVAFRLDPARGGE